MTNLFLTYAWKDNEDQQVDFVISELENAGLIVRFDRAHLVPGQRLWENLDRAITEPGQSDAWAIYATTNSLSSEACLEELAYALDRTLRMHGHQFPLIGIFPEPLDRSLIPSAIATRLYVTLNDPDWASKVAAGAQGRPPKATTDVQPYIIRTHRKRNAEILELRPRAGRWYPFLVVVPEKEHHMLRAISYGPHGGPPDVCMVARNDVSIGNLNGKDYRGIRLQHPVDYLNSVYVELSEIPSEVLFGPEKGPGYQLLKRQAESLAQ